MSLSTTTVDPLRPGPPVWSWHAHAPGSPAEPVARAWLAAQLDVVPELLALPRDPRGRPRLGPPFAGHDCNWSHSGDGLLVVLGVGMRVGADLERLRPRARALPIAERYFTAAEATWLRTHAGGARDHAFLRLWCAKEAVLKAHGHGLAFGLDRLEFAPGGGALHLVACDPALGRPQDWSLQALEPAPGYVGALAWHAPIEPVEEPIDGDIGNTSAA